MADLAARHRRMGPQTEAAALEVLRSGRYIGGPVVQETERQLAALFEMAHGVGVGSGTCAVELALRALGIGPGHRVALPALSFFATAEAVLLVGAEPVFVDTLPERPVMDPAKVPDGVDAVILVQLFGVWSPAPKVQVPLISDTAQAAGWGHGRPPGVMATLSLYPSKTLGCAGDGGAVLTDDPAMAARVRSLGSHGVDGGGHTRLGRNSRLDAVQAAVVHAQLPDLPRRIRRRREIASRYDLALGEGPLRPCPRAPNDPVAHYLVRSRQRDALARWLAEQDIESRVYYSQPMPSEPLLEPLRCAPTPNARAWCDETLAIPCHGELSDAQVQQVSDALGVWQGLP